VTLPVLGSEAKSERDEHDARHDVDHPPHRGHAQRCAGANDEREPAERQVEKRRLWAASAVNDDPN
jgi:hypothetical protein